MFWILWDNDGVLVDTEKAFLKATMQALTEVGIEFSKDLYIQLVLEQGKNFIAHHLEGDPRFQPTLSRRNEIYHNLLLSSDWVSDATRVLLARFHKNYRMGVVTGGSRETIIPLHSKSGIQQYFEFYITEEDYTHPKPSPEPYSLARTKFNIDPKNALVVEDTLRGWKSASAAGFKCVLLNNSSIRSNPGQDLEIISSLDDLDALLPAT